VPTKLAQKPLFLSVGMRRDEPARRAVLLGNVHEAPVGQLRDD
jgi:hypothetical protein